MTSSPSRALTAAPNRFRTRGFALSVAGAGCALASAAQAQIVYGNIVFSGPQSITSSANIDLNFDGTNDITFSPSKGPIFNDNGATNSGLVAVVSSTVNAPLKFAAGTVISSANTYGTGNFATGTTWANGDTGYIGFSFLSGSSKYYGWMEVTVTSHGSSSGTVMDWAYNSNPGQSILAGQIPEPATSALAAGAVALGGALWLKRRWRPSRGASSDSSASPALAPASAGSSQAPAAGV